MKSKCTYWSLNHQKRMMIVLVVTFILLNSVVPKEITELIPKGGYPKEVEDLFKKVPDYEYYEPKKGKSWGYVPPEGRFPYEAEPSNKVFFRSTGEPQCKYPSKKYIIVYYDSPKTSEVKTKKGQLLYIPYVLLVEGTFDRAMKNGIEVPVFNPTINKVIEIKIDRKFKKPITHKKHRKNGKRLKNNMKGPKNEHKKKGKKTKKGSDGLSDDEKKKKIEELWRKRLISKRKAKGEAEAYEKAKEYAKTHIDYWRAFKDREQPQLRVLDVEQRKATKNGGYDLGVKQDLEYIKGGDISEQEVRNSIMYPPMYCNMPQMPKEAKINFLDMERSLIVRIQPPMPTVPGSKWTFFYVAPTKFKYPDGRKVWLPVYILVPYDSDEKPTDLRSFHTYKMKVQIGLTSRKIVHIPNYDKPVWTPKKFDKMIMEQQFINMPQKPFDRQYYLTPEEFELFLKSNKLVNSGIGFREANVIKTLDPFKKFLKKVMLSFSKRGAFKEEFMRGGMSAQEKLAKSIESEKKQRRRMFMKYKRKHNKGLSAMRRRVKNMNMKLALLKSMLKAQKKKKNKHKKGKKTKAASKHNAHKKNKKGKNKSKKEPKKKKGHDSKEKSDK